MPLKLSATQVQKSDLLLAGLSVLEPEIPGLYRIEVDPRGDGYDEALAARVADPLWFITRQWQFREFDGEDAGSPLDVDYALEGTPVLGFAPGSDPAVDAFAPLARTPLETLVEAEPVLHGAVQGEPGSHPRANIEAGQVLLRMLADAGLDIGATLGQSWPAQVVLPADPLSDPAGTLWHLLLQGGVDAAAFAAELRALADGAGGFVALPAPLQAAGVGAEAHASLAAWLAWMDEFIYEQSNAAWSPQRQEYAFELAAGRGEAQRLRLDAQEYVDGRIDWHDFDLRAGEPALMPGDAGTLDDRVTRRSFATPVVYPGMPATRFWEFEDANVNFARIEAGSLDLVRMMMAEYALVHGNDWFMVPARVSAGALYRVASMSVTDSFGIVTEVPAIDTGGAASWRLQGLSRIDKAPGAARLGTDGGWMFITPPLSDTLEGPALEQVAFARDEMANLAWAIEKRVQGTSGEPLERSLEDQRYAIRQLPSVPSTDANLLYRLMTPVPSHWLPLLPVRQAGSLGLGIRLERGGMKRFYRKDGAARDAVPGYEEFLQRLAETAALPNSFVEALASSDPDIVIYAFHPRGRILRADLAKPVASDGLRIEEEELSRCGFVVERRFQYARTADGRALLWVGRRKRIGRGEAGSGLAFDLGVKAGLRI